MNTTLPELAPTVATATLYLTEILVPYDDAIRLLGIRDTYDWHQRAWQAFGARDDARRDFLIRVDRKEECYRMLILSRSEPVRPNWCPIPCFRSRIISDAFFAHARYRFSLLANPTRKLRVDNPDGSRKKNGRRVPLATREERVAWLQRKADAGGFSVNVDALRVIPRGREFFHKDGRSHGTHTAADFQGELQVRDAARFRDTVTSGIGPAKAFGFGLLALAPLS